MVNITARGNWEEIDPSGVGGFGQFLWTPIFGLTPGTMFEAI